MGEIRGGAWKWEWESCRLKERGECRGKGLGVCSGAVRGKGGRRARRVARPSWLVLAVSRSLPWLMPVDDIIFHIHTVHIENAYPNKTNIIQSPKHHIPAIVKPIKGHNLHYPISSSHPFLHDPSDAATPLGTHEQETPIAPGYCSQPRGWTIDPECSANESSAKTVGDPSVSVRGRRNGSET
jgi:hypothetical protein